jgi:hypothetical protein
MFDDLGSFVQTALAVVSIATLAGLGFIRGTVSKLRSDLSDSRAREEDLRKQHDDDVRKMTAFEAAQDAQAREIVTLREMVLGKMEWDVLTRKLDDHHAEATTHWKRDETLLARVVTLLEKEPTP